MGASTYDFWLLDLDGTVVDTEQSYIQDVFGAVGRRLDVSFSEREREALWYGFAGERERVLAAADVDPERFWSVFHEVEDPERRAAATHLYSDAASFVPALDQPTGIVTHCQPHLTEPVLDSLDIADWFDTVVCCNDEMGWKPDPGPVELAMQELGVDSTHEGVLVGDDPNDIGAAQNADLSAIHVTRREPTEWSSLEPESQHMDPFTRGHERVGSFTELDEHASEPVRLGSSPQLVEPGRSVTESDDLND
jgi:phosphoglycolate phosphatase